MYATFNITSNRFKYYPQDAPRLTPEQDTERRAANFQWYPGQKCFSAIWTPQAEDFILGFVDSIEQDDTPDDVEARVNRYGHYAEDAEDSSQAATRRAMDATTARRERLASNTAISENERAIYWERRIAGAISHAAHHDRPETCANRIKGLEADQRKQERNLQHAQHFLAAWSAPDLDRQTAVNIANFDHLTVYFPKDKYPASTYEGATSLWGGLDKCTIDATQAAALAIPGHEAEIRHASRWLEHIARRLDYERAYLAALGGSALLEPAPRRKPAPAPADGLKKGDTVTYMGGPYYNQPKTGKIVSMGSKTVKDALRAAMLARLQPQRAEARARADALCDNRHALKGEAADRSTVRDMIAGHPYDLFPTPADLAARMVRMSEPDLGLVYCEPEAGTGAIADVIRRLVDPMTLLTVEINYTACEYLTRKGYPVTRGDFLEQDLTADRFVMNPPFSNGADRAHVDHARALLRPGGLIVAILSNSAKSHDYAQAHAETIEELPPGTFRASGTNVPALLVTIRKD